MQTDIKHITIAGIDYDAERRTNEDGSGVGYIELRQPGAAEPLARISYRGPELPMDFCTYDVPLPLAAVHWLVEKGDEALAPVSGYK